MTIETQAPIIVTDATCDILHASLTHYDVRVLPLRIHFGDDESYLSGVEMNLDEFIARMEKGGEHPTTSPPTEDDFVEFYQALIPLGRPILSIPVSIQLSQTIASAQRAARKIDHPIEVWDSKMVSGTLGLQVLTAARAAAAGYTVPQITPLLDHTYQASELMFCMDDLSFLYQGGRIGRVSYTVAQALRLKPIVTVSKDGPAAGTYIPGPERPHSLKSAVDAFMRAAVKDVGARNAIRAFISYGEADSQELAGILADKLRERFEISYLEMGPSTPLLVVHVGKKSLALSYAKGAWEV